MAEPEQINDLCKTTFSAFDAGEVTHLCNQSGIEGGGKVELKIRRVKPLGRDAEVQIEIVIDHILNRAHASFIIPSTHVYGIVEKMLGARIAKLERS